MVSFRAWLLLLDEEFSNDAERRAEPVSPFSETANTRQQSEPSRRFRSRVSARPSQQRSSYGSSIRTERAASNTMGLRDLKTSRQGSTAQQDQETSAREFAAAAGFDGLRHSDRSTNASGGGGLSEPSSRTGEIAKASTRSSRPGLTSRLVLALIRGYQRSISPSLGNVCRFEPTCSRYTYEAIECHGLLKGAWLGFKRVTNCRPLGGRGYDPVPK